MINLLDWVRGESTDDEFIDLVAAVMERLESIEDRRRAEMYETYYKFDTQYEHVEPDFDTLEMYERLLTDRKIWEKENK